jgi:hypothetical protein
MKKLYDKQKLIIDDIIYLKINILQNLTHF